MESCPAPLLAEVMYCLTPKEVMLVFQRICKSCHLVYSESFFLTRYLLTLFHADNSLPIDPGALTRVLMHLVAGFPGEKLPFVGLATNGGVDNDMTYYWTDGAFKPFGGSGYSSRETQGNISLIAGLYNSQSSTDEIAQAKKFIAQMMRKNRIMKFLDGRRLKEGVELSDRELMVFEQFWAQRSDIFLINTPAEDRALVTSKLTQDLAAISRTYPTLHSFYRYPDNNMVLVDVEKSAEVERNEMAAVVTSVTVSREGEYTCPVKTFLLLSSFTPIDIESDDLKLYDSLHLSTDIDHLANTIPSFPVISPPEDNKECTVLTFGPTNLALRPLLWCQFKKAGARVTVKLPYGVLCRYLFLKLIDCENRMEEMGDPGAAPNIDVASVRAYGTLLSLTPRQ